MTQMNKYEVAFKPTDKVGDHYQLTVTAPSLFQAVTLAHQNLGKIIGRANARTYAAFMAQEKQS
jgi:hypothetical protein